MTTDSQTSDAVSRTTENPAPALSAPQDAAEFPCKMKITDLQALIKESFDSCHDYMRQKGVKLSLKMPAGPISLTADDEQIGCVLGHLLGNALRHVSAHEGAIFLSLQEMDREVIVEVSDNGTGIEPSQQFRIFEKFYRVPGDTWHGKGLGLYIARGIVTAHGGRIGVRSLGPGQGSTFFFSLPKSGAATPDCLPTAGGGAIVPGGPQQAEGSRSASLPAGRRAVPWSWCILAFDMLFPIFAVLSYVRVELATSKYQPRGTMVGQAPMSNPFASSERPEARAGKHR